MTKVLKRERRTVGTPPDGQPATGALRVLQLAQKPQRRGAEVFAFQLSVALRRLGHSVGTAYLYPFDGVAALPLGDQDEVLGAAGSYGVDRYIGANPRLVRRVLEAIDAFRPDIVQLNGARTVKYGAIARRLRLGAGWRAIYRNIGNPGDWGPTGPKRWIFRSLVSVIDGSIALNPAAVTALRARHSPHGRYAVIPNAIDGESLRPQRSREAVRADLDTPSDVPVILSVGSLSPEKRTDLLLEAFTLLRSQVPDAILWIVGDGPLRDDLRHQASASGSAPFVRFPGVMPDIASTMAAADVLALTSDTEGIPAVILEAGYLGLPVVATRVGGLTECVRHDESGILVEPRDVPGIASALMALLADPARRTRLGEGGRQYIRSTFTMDVIAGRYLDFYRTVLAPE